MRQYIPRSGTLRLGFQAPLELCRQHRIELFQPPEDKRDFIPLSDANMGSPQFEPQSGMKSRDRKSTRLNSSHDQISYAVFCLKKKKHRSELQSLSDIVYRVLFEKIDFCGWTGKKARNVVEPETSKDQLEIARRSYEGLNKIG